MTNKGDWKQIYLIIAIFLNLPGKIKEANLNFYFIQVPQKDKSR